LTRIVHNLAVDAVRVRRPARDGSTVPVARFPITKGYAAWGAPAAIDRNTLAAARLITSNGRTLATAHFR
jgi:hypothetical protein